MELDSTRRVQSRGQLRVKAVLLCFALSALAASVLVGKADTARRPGELEAGSPAVLGVASYWGADAPGWWSEFPVFENKGPDSGAHATILRHDRPEISLMYTSGEGRRVAHDIQTTAAQPVLQQQQLQFQSVKHMTPQSMLGISSYGKKAEAQQRLQAKALALTEGAARASNTTAGLKGSELQAKRSRVAEQWLHARRSSRTDQGHWVWVPSEGPTQTRGPEEEHRRYVPTAPWRDTMKNSPPRSSIPYRIGSYTMHKTRDRDPYSEAAEDMPFRNGIYTRQHWWDTDGIRRVWDTDNFAASADASIARNGRLFGYGA